MKDVRDWNEKAEILHRRILQAATDKDVEKAEKVAIEIRQLLKPIALTSAEQLDRWRKLSDTCSILNEHVLPGLSKAIHGACQELIDHGYCKVRTPDVEARIAEISKIHFRMLNFFERAKEFSKDFERLCSITPPVAPSNDPEHLAKFEDEDIEIEAAE